MLINIGEEKMNYPFAMLNLKILSNILKNEKEMLFDGDMQ